MELKIIAITSKGEEAIKNYIDRSINPSTKDRIKLWNAKKISKLLYKGQDPPKMLREEWDEKNNSYSVIVEDAYIQYADELLDKSKINFFKLTNTTEDDYNMEELK